MSDSIIVQWPTSLPSCPNGWSEKPLPMVIRSEVQVGVAKTRLRYTRPRLSAQANFIVLRGGSNAQPSDTYLQFWAFFSGTCLGGARPFYFRHPFSKLMVVWRWAEEPTVSDFEGRAFQISCNWEEM